VDFSSHRSPGADGLRPALVVQNDVLNSSKLIGMFEFSRLRRELSQLLGCEVDLATPDALHKDMKEDILKEAIRTA